MSESTETRRISFHFLLAAGLLWGLSEAGLGLFLRGFCQTGVSSAILTGAAFLFMAAVDGFGVKRRWLTLLPMVAILLKTTEAPILGIPLSAPGIVNPSFALLMEFAALFAVLLLLGRSRGRRLGTDMAGGAMIALLAAPLFLLVGLFSSQPACVVSGTRIPVSLYYAPLSAVISAVTFPCGLRLGSWLSRTLSRRTASLHLSARFLDAFSLSALLATLLIAFLRK